MLALKHNQRGDTIIEVMVALAVLGLAFAISYATANHALNGSQNSQEHGQALQILDSQVEMARANVANSSLYSYSNPGQTFCMNPATQAPVPASDSSCQMTDGGAQYQIIDSYSPVSVSGGSCSTPSTVCLDNFTFKITWNGIGNLGNQQESVNYQLPENYGVLAGGGGAVGGNGSTVLSCPAGDLGTYPDCVQPGSLTVVAKKIAPDAGSTTPSCSEAASQNEAGTTIGLYLGGSQVSSQTTDNSSTTTFNNLLSGSSYTAQIDGVPSGYQACAPTSQSVTVAPYTSTTVNLKIRPICTPTYEVTGYTWQWGVAGYQYIPYSYWGVVGYQYDPVYTYELLYYEPVYIGSYWGITGWTYTYNGSGYTEQPIYGWVPEYNNVPVYGYVQTGWSYDPVYGWVNSYYYEPIYGWVYVPSYGYVNECP